MNESITLSGVLLGMGITIGLEVLALVIVAFILSGREDKPYNGGPYGGGSPDV